MPLVFVKSLRRHRYRDGDGIAQRIARHHARGANAAGVFLAVDSDPGLADGFEVAQKLVEPRQRALRAPLIACADQPRDRRILEFGEIGFAVGRAMQRKGLADGGHGAQPLRSGHLIDEHEVVLLDGRKIDGLLELVRELNEERPGDGHEVGARRGGEAENRRSEPHPSVGRGGDEKFFSFQRANNALHGRTRKSHALRNLTEAQTGRLLLERAQDRRRPRNDLHLALALSLAVCCSCARLHPSPPFGLQSCSSLRLDTGLPPSGTEGC